MLLYRKQLIKLVFCYLCEPSSLVSLHPSLTILGIHIRISFSLGLILFTLFTIIFSPRTHLVRPTLRRLLVLSYYLDVASIASANWLNLWLR